ncbi:MAG: hypothetical protein ACREMT_07935 [Vulcanimicrobiaceae bacterium]
MVFLFVAAIFAGCAQNGGITYPVVLLNSSQNTMTLNLSALGTPQTITVAATNGSSSTVYTATPGSGCAGVATITGNTTATTSTGASASFTVLGLTIAPAGTCTVGIASSVTATAATLNINTGSVPTAAPTSIGITGKH